VTQYNTADASNPSRHNQNIWGFSSANPASSYLNRYHVRFGPAENSAAKVRENGLFALHYVPLAAELWLDSKDGWLAVMTPVAFHDFAGSTVVHTIGGAISLAGAIALGPRLGRVFKRDGGTPMKPHDLIIGAAGGLILWFGWYGFNPGSTLSALDAQGIGRVSFNTTIAACSAGLTGLFISYYKSGKWDLALTVNGFLAGLVAITCPCYWVDPEGAFLLGIVAGFVVAGGIDLLEYLRIDDPIGAVPVHMVCGIWGTLSLGLFATGAYGAYARRLYAASPEGDAGRTELCLAIWRRALSSPPARLVWLTLASPVFESIEK